jgi:twitching motility two-component system response regulator PilG
VNQATVVYAPLPRNGDPVPWLARLGYVKKPQDSSTYECQSLKVPLKGSFMESMITTAKPKLAGLKVLVIDDSKTIRRTAETLLTKEGCEVFTAVDGFDALSKIADHQPDIVFVDIMMPRLDGYQTCSLIKHNKVFKQIPVIMLSSKDGLFDRARGRIVGSEHYLTKPFTKDELLGAIEAHVGK